MCGVTEGLAAPVPPPPIGPSTMRVTGRENAFYGHYRPRRRYADGPSKQNGQPAGFLFRATFATKDTLGDPNTVFVDSEGGAPEGGPLMPLFVWVPSLFMARNCLLCLPTAYPGKIRG